MSRRARETIVLAIAVLGAAVLLLFSQSFQTCIYPNTHDYQGNTLQKDYWSVAWMWGWCFTGAIHDYAEFIAALAAIAIAWFTLSLRESTDKLWKASEHQLRAMRQSIFATTLGSRAAAKQAKLAQETFEKLERPYLYVSGVTIFQINEDSIDPFVTYDVANHGKVAAKVEAVYIHNSPGTSAEPDNALLIDLVEEPMLTRIFGPGETKLALTNYAPIGLNWQYIVPNKPFPVLSRDEEWFFYVEVHYGGPFTKGHTTKACWRYDRSLWAFVESNDDRFNLMT
jgi:hypothetical protein